jgi:hypothetical protein
MFEVPEAKRVKRTEFFEQDAHPGDRSGNESDEDVEAAPAYGFEYDFIDVNSSMPEPNLAKGPEHAEDVPKGPREEKRSEHKFAFNLFAPSTGPEDTATKHAKITLRASPSPGDAQSEGRFLKPNRLDTYYFTSSLSQSELEQLRSQYLAVAVTSDEIFRRSKTTWPGMRMAWKVIAPKSVVVRHKGKSPVDTRYPALNEDMNAPFEPAYANTKREIPGAAATQTTLPPLSASGLVRRTKPSKKRRIFLRKRLAMQTKLTGEAKNQAIREKKSAMNRKNKLRRREKEREKKKAAQGEGNADEDIETKAA